MGSDYRQHCREYVSSALARPEMYFGNLEELEALLHGHGYAFTQLGLVGDRADTFNAAFGSWLAERHQLSAAGGWANALQQDAEAKAVAPLSLLAERLNEFWDDW